MTKKTPRQWREITSDHEFFEAMKGATIVEALPSYHEKGVSYIDADIFWKLSSGVVLAMHLAQGGGCPTCGYGGDEKTYYRLDPT